MATTRNPNQVELFNKHVSTWFFEGMDAAISGEGLGYRALANIRTLQNPKDVIASFVGGGLYSRHGEWETARIFEPGSGWKIGVYPLIYQNAFQVAKASMEYGDSGMTAEQARMLGAYGIQTLDYIFASLFNNAFDGTNYPVYDGKALCATDHVLKNAAGTFANRPAVGTALDATSLGEGITYFMDMPNDDGMRMQMTPRYLIVHPTKTLSAQQLLNSASPLTAPNENVRSTVYGRGITLLPWAKLSSTTAWFLTAAPGDLKSLTHGLDLWFSPGGQPMTKTRLLEDPDGIKHIGRFRTAPLVTKVRGVWGNPGA